MPLPPTHRGFTFNGNADSRETPQSSLHAGKGFEAWFRGEYHAVEVLEVGHETSNVKWDYDGSESEVWNYYIQQSKAQTPISANTRSQEPTQPGSKAQTPISANTRSQEPTQPRSRITGSPWAANMVGAAAAAAAEDARKSRLTNGSSTTAGACSWGTTSCALVASTYHAGAEVEENSSYRLTNGGSTTAAASSWSTTSCASAASTYHAVADMEDKSGYRATNGCSKPAATSSWSTPSTASTASKFRVGASVEGKYGDRWFDAVLVEMHDDGKMTLRWDYNGKETPVPQSDVRLKDTDANCSSEEAASTSFYQAERWHAEEVEAPSSEVEAPSAAPRASSSTSAFSKGCIVEGQFEEWWYDAVVVSTADDGTVLLRWDYDSTESSVPSTDVRLKEATPSPIIAASSDTDFVDGAVVESLYRDRWFDATIIEVKKTTMKIRWGFNGEEAIVPTRTVRLKDTPQGNVDLTREPEQSTAKETVEVSRSWETHGTTKAWPSAASRVVSQPARHQDKQRLTGRILWFSREKGFGFVSCNQVPQDVFLHSGSIDGPPPEEVKKDKDGLASGPEVEFTLGTGNEGKLKALNAHIIVRADTGITIAGAVDADDDWRTWVKETAGQHSGQEADWTPGAVQPRRPVDANYIMKVLERLPKDAPTEVTEYLRGLAQAANPDVSSAGGA